MRIGLYGGTFDPIHLAHLVLAEQCREQRSLDEVWFLPAGQPPHKPGAVITPGKLRQAMIEVALSGHARFRVDPWELDQPGPSFTVETLRHFTNKYPEHQFVWLIGGDSLHDLPTWRDPAGILDLAEIAAVNRGEGALPSLEPLRTLIGEERLSRIHEVRMPGIMISASDLRQRVANGKSIRFLVPRAVEVLILDNRLYRGNDCPS